MSKGQRGAPACVPSLRTWRYVAWLFSSTITSWFSSWTTFLTRWPTGFLRRRSISSCSCFCIHCPDPVAALDIVLEARRPITAKQVVDVALSRQPRSVADVPASELPLTHPLRQMHHQREWTRQDVRRKDQGE